MPRGGVCNHPNCDGGPCKQLTDDEIEPGPVDTSFAKNLKAEGWEAVSTKYRRIARWKLRLRGEELVRPELHDFLSGRKAIEALTRMFSHLRDHLDDPYLTEVRELTLKQFRAFKRLERAEWQEYLRRMLGDEEYERRRERKTL